MLISMEAKHLQNFLNNPRIHYSDTNFSIMDDDRDLCSGTLHSYEYIKYTYN